MSLKDIFSQEVKNMMEKENAAQDNVANNSASEAESYIEQRANEERMKFAREAAEQNAQRSSQAASQPKAEQAKAENSGSEQFFQTPPPKAPSYSPSYPKPDFSDDDETTIISRNTVVEGNIRSFANVNVEGSIKGDLLITKDAHVSGKLVGNLECNNAAMIGSQMQGNVLSKGQVKFNKDSLILGNINASYLDMNGKVKGDIDINGKAEFKSDSYILGDITVASLTVHDGATINGHVNTTFLADNPQAIFPEMINMAE